MYVTSGETGRDVLTCLMFLEGEQGLHCAAGAVCAFPQHIADSSRTTVQVSIAQNHLARMEASQ